jgi:hypothetical protein
MKEMQETGKFKRNEEQGTDGENPESKEWRKKERKNK